MTDAALLRLLLLDARDVLRSLRCLGGTPCSRCKTIDRIDAALRETEPAEEGK